MHLRQGQQETADPSPSSPSSRGQVRDDSAQNLTWFEQKNLLRSIERERRERRRFGSDEIFGANG
jgi:hypothetical protein